MNKRSKKIVTIIGSNSYIARNLIKTMDKDLYILNLYDYQDKSFDNHIQYKKVDILSLDSLDKIEVNCDLIFLFSGLTGTSNGFEKYNDFIDINEKGLLNILNTMVRKNSKAKIIFPSTRLVYKGMKDYALKEDSEKEFKTVYALNKFTCEGYLSMYKNSFGINYCIYRICVPYGNLVDNLGSYGTIEFFLSKAAAGNNLTIYGDGLQKRSFIHIFDLCSILLNGSLDERCESDVFNIGGPDSLSILQVAESIANIYKVGIEYLEWPPLALKIESGDTIFDSSKIENLLNYQYKYSYFEWINSKLSRVIN